MSRNAPLYFSVLKNCLFSAPGITKDLHLRDIAVTQSEITLTWERPPSYCHPVGKSSMVGRFRLTGYFLTGMSKRQALKEIIDFGLSNYKAAALTPGTKYNIMLRPVYVSDRSETPAYRIGRASTIDIQTLASGEYKSFPRSIKGFSEVSWFLKPILFLHLSLGCHTEIMDLTVRSCERHLA